jgi:hypothetical protein
MPSIIGSEYNSQKPDLIISEYGRGVQDLIEKAKAVEDPVLRQRMAEAIIEVMRIVNPQKSAFEDITEKLWKHLFRIAGYDIDVTPPSGEKPVPPDPEEARPEMSYPVQEVRFRHYGHNIQVLVRKAQEMEAGPKRDELVKIIGSYMKLAYKTWNREHFVADELIKGDLETLSGNALSLNEDVQFDTALAPVSFASNMPGTGGRKSGKYHGRAPANRRQGNGYKSRRRK